ncbi:oxaloacetate decarboxylase [bacterium]|nr:oxaloacetate decarboxylase [bacterium]
MFQNDDHNGPRALRALINHEPIVRCMGAHDVITAKILEQAGIESIFLGGFGVSASMLGLPDMNFVHLPMMADAAKRTINAVEVPVIVDGDTGHGDLHNVQQTTEIFEQVGAAGILLEDQDFPKRCGHFSGKRVIPQSEMILKIHAALDVRKNPDMVLIARTDALACEGSHAAIDRAKAYAEAGADLVYVEAPDTVELLESLPERIGYPLVINMLAGGKTPPRSIQQLRSYGYKLAIYPIETILVTASIVQDLVHELLTEGRLDGFKDRMLSFQNIQDILGLPSILDIRSRMEQRAASWKRTT